MPARFCIRQIFVALMVLFAIQATCAHAQNLLVEGGDFEAGTNGFGITPVLLVRNWPTYVEPSIDSTTAGQGRRSLKLVNGSGEDVFEIRSRAFHIDHPQGELSVSFYAKTDTPGANVSASIYSGPAAIAGRTFRISGEWERYSFTIRPQVWTSSPDSGRSSVEGVFFLKLLVPALKPWKTLWLDGIQAQLGPVTPYAPPSTESLAFSIDRTIAVYHPDEVPRIVLHAAGPGIAGQVVKVQLEELLSGDKEPVMQLKLGADGDSDHGQVLVPLSPRPRGCYRLTAWTGDGKAVQYRGFGVIESLANRPHAQRAFFGGSIETFQCAPGFAADGIPIEPGDSLISSHYSPDAQFALARDLGWGWWHAYWPYSPLVLNPDGKRFLWRDADTLADLARKHDLEILANLCAHGSSRQLPDWMRGDQISLGGMAMGKGDRLLDQDKFREYAEAVTDHFKDKIKMWEPWNEPSVKVRAAEYVPLLRAAYTGIKAADPTATVYGLCGTWDIGGDLYGWVRNCLKLGAADCMDKISIHGYHVMERRYAAKVKQMAKELTGRDWAVADTEAGPYVTFQVYPQLVDAMYAGAPDDLDDTIGSMPRLYINELSNGVERGSWFNLTSYYAGIHYRDLVMLEYDGSPTPAMIAYNTLVDLLGPAKHYRSVPMGGDVAIEVFLDGDGRPLATLWADKSPQTLEIPLSASHVALIDLLGRSHTPAPNGDGIELKLGKRPIFLRADTTLSADQLVAALGKSAVKDLDDLELTRVGLSRDKNGQPALAVVVKGKTAQPLAGELHVSGSPWNLSTWTRSFSPIQVDESRILDFPLSRAPIAPANNTVNLSVELGNSKVLSWTRQLKIWSIPHLAKPVPIDGDLSEWDPSSFRAIADWVKAAGAWDSRGVYFAIRCQDKTPQLHVPTATPWRSDSVELYFNPSIQHSFQDGEFYPGDAQVICPVPGLQDSLSPVFTAYRGQPPGSDLNKSPRMRPEYIVMAAKRSDGGYTMEIFVPWKNFPENFAPRAGNFMGFSIAARDVDKNGVELHRVLWAGDDTDYRDTSGYGLLLLTQ
jgi:hypothetical protein